MLCLAASDQDSPILQANPAAGRFGFSWPSPGGWTEFRPFQMFRGGQRVRDAHRRQRDGRRRGENEATFMLYPQYILPFLAFLRDDSNTQCEQAMDKMDPLERPDSCCLPHACSNCAQALQGFWRGKQEDSGALRLFHQQQQRLIKCHTAV